MLRTSDLDYDLPPDLIATQPVTPRDSARMLVVDRASAAIRGHAVVRDLPGLLRPGDLLVFNTTRVIPARFFGRRAGSGGRVEGLYLHDSAEVPTEEPAAGWVALLRGGHLRPGAEVELLDAAGAPSGLTLSITGRCEPGAWTATVRGGGPDSAAILERIGHTPLPPYIVKARMHAHQAPEEAVDRERYQTVYANAPGSVAAPTAGLHFTPELLASLEKHGVEKLNALLHVGAGTFKPVETEFVEDHPMHEEWCSLSDAAVSMVREAKTRGGRVIAVGTTAARTLESYAATVERGMIPPRSIETRLLITPGFRFAWVDGLLTNFHLPRSTLLAMVAAFLPGGVAPLKDLYARAVAERYRFYSFGDAMLIV